MRTVAADRWLQFKTEDANAYTRHVNTTRGMGHPGRFYPDAGGRTRRRRAVQPALRPAGADPQHHRMTRLAGVAGWWLGLGSVQSLRVPDSLRAPSRRDAARHRSPAPSP